MQRVDYNRGMDGATRAAIEANLFPAARAAVESWDRFPWHRARGGSIQTVKIHSSQALALDVFGTIKTARSRDSVMTSVAEALRLPARGPWSIEMEWEDRPDNRSQEPRPTQVDAVAQGGESLVFFECKFTESNGGRCSQTRCVSLGAGERRAQCNGDYAPQRNPVNGKDGRCALSAKKIEYWRIIPEVFELSAARDHRPCPFAGPWFQWMRNLVLCREIARARRRRPAFVIAFADAIGLAVADKVRGGGFGDLEARLRPGSVAFRTASFQEIIAAAARGSEARAEDKTVWEPLSEWVTRKIGIAGASRQAR